MTIVEPTTMLTDYALAGLSLWLARRLLREPETRHRSVVFWACGLACLGVASLAGGTVHGLKEVLSVLLLRSLWKLSVYAVGAASFCLFVGTLIGTVPLSQRRFVSWIPYVQLAAYAWWMATHDEFRFVLYDYAPTLLVVTVLQASAWFSRRAQSAPWLIAGMLVSILAASVQAGGFSLHEHFNHNDLYHVIQMGGMVLFYRGAVLLRDR